MSKNTLLGFGFNPEESQNHFLVVIPPKGAEGQIKVYERFEWTQDVIDDADVKKGEEKLPGGQIIRKRDVLRMEISKHKWNLLAKDIAAEFNSRLKEDKKPIGKFSEGGVPVEKLFGKEMMVLLWGVEFCDPSNIPTAIKNWKGFMPEERWWLYTTTNASTGGLKERKGWRTALRYALCENPIEENPQLTLEDFFNIGV